MCRFCDDFEFTASLGEQSKLNYTYSVAYLNHVIEDGKLRSRTEYFMKDGVGYPLNFCPECGKKLLGG